MEMESGPGPNTNVTSVSQLTDCEICLLTIPQSSFLNHIESCAQDSKVVYNLKMSSLHEFKAEDLVHSVHSHYSTNRKADNILVPGGVCFYCETPQNHENCRDREATILKIEKDYFWNISQQHEFLVKAIVGMMEIRQNRELGELFEEFPESVINWSETSCNWIQEKRKAHQAKINSRVELLEKNCHLKLLNHKKLVEQLKT